MPRPIAIEFTYRTRPAGPIVTGRVHGQLQDDGDTVADLAGLSARRTSNDAGEFRHLLAGPAGRNTLSLSGRSPFEFHGFSHGPHAATSMAVMGFRLGTPDPVAVGLFEVGPGGVSFPPGPGRFAHEPFDPGSWSAAEDAVASRELARAAERALAAPPRAGRPVELAFRFRFEPSREGLVEVAGRVRGELLVDDDTVVNLAGLAGHAGHWGRGEFLHPLPRPLGMNTLSLSGSGPFAFHGFVADPLTPGRATNFGFLVTNDPRAQPQVLVGAFVTSSAGVEPPAGSGLVISGGFSPGRWTAEVLAGRAVARTG